MQLADLCQIYGPSGHEDWQCPASASRQSLDPLVGTSVILLLNAAYDPATSPAFQWTSVRHSDSPQSPSVEVICLDSSRDLMYSIWEQEELLSGTLELLKSLPLDVYPSHTARKYAHVLNVLAARWLNRDEFVTAAGCFLRSPEWPREGFPRPVFFEILNLAAYHGSLPYLGVLDMARLNLKPGT